MIAAEFSIIPEALPGLSKEIGKRLEDMLNPVVRAASARVPLAATTMAERPGVIRHGEAPASVVVEVFTAEVLVAEALVAAAEGGIDRDR